MQQHILRQRYFLPFFLTQFFGAMNDNLFKTVILISFTVLAPANASLWSNSAHLVFVLPFFLFSAWSGHYGDQVEKSQWIVKIKCLEVLIMVFGVCCIWFDWLSGLLVMLFLMGTQSTLFSPVKFAIIPEQVPLKELTQANAWVELGTFLAILIGNLIAGLVFELALYKVVISCLLMSVAVFGVLTARKIPPAPPSTKGQTQRRSTIGLLKAAKQQHNLFMGMLGVSWFWFLGSAYLTQLPVYVTDYLNAEPSAIALFLVAFSIGVGVGSLLCSRWSDGRLEIGLVPIGAFGLSLFGALLAIIEPITGAQLSFSETLSSLSHWGVFCVLLGLGAAGGMYIVPLYGLVQTRSEPAQRSQMIAANNILNALFMVFAAIAGLVCLSWLEFDLAQFFWLLVVLNLLVACYIFTLTPEFIARLGVWLLVNCLYRVRCPRLAQAIPAEGGVLVVANHVSYVDALLIGGLLPRPSRFVMFKPIFELPIIHFICKTLNTIPVDSKRNDPQAYERAFEQMIEALQRGEVVVLFPEGQLTRDGEIGRFKAGILKILAQVSVPVIPIGLSGLWGSVFSHKDGPALKKLPKRLRARVTVDAGDIWPVAEPMDLEKLRERVKSLVRVE